MGKKSMNDRERLSELRVELQKDERAKSSEGLIASFFLCCMKKFSKKISHLLCRIPGFVFAFWFSVLASCSE